ncbi:hypothetical protein [Aquimarina sp. MMG016]|uniref:hypothetical protein n=1 Tax=Aquimarina sp. MMG016 TaxID=2822690 RepID=UPI001B3A535D|nr:hypothetical protein [Aquimarina sp. MMG016]MBQ4821397.1 hypothetical protein [Aquimarina sp. MMG016]
MKKYASYILLLLMSTICFQGCDDVIEDDITNDLVTAVAPLDMAEIEGNTVQFRWNGIEGADEYRIQINNQETNAIILDSLVIKSVFDYAMNPGSYQWRVRGENFAYVTAYTFDSRFTVAASTDLSNQTVTLTSPANGIFTNNSALTFTWDPISTATFYKIKISKIDGSTETLVFDNDGNNIIGTSITIGNSVISEDGEYKWEIQAGNDSSTSEFFPRTFSLDTQAPPTPTLTEPTTGQTASVDEEISFKWTFADTGVIQSGITSTIQIATDQTFNDVIETNSNPLAIDEYTFTFTTAGTYFWRVRGIDDAGNTGDFSDASQIIIN